MIGGGPLVVVGARVDPRLDLSSTHGLSAVCAREDL
jgi:hypothetical protein